MKNTKLISLIIFGSLVLSINPILGTNDINNQIINDINSEDFGMGSKSIVWDVAMSIDEPGGFGDDAWFGEAPDANDGPPADSYDVLHPPSGPTPYLNAWFDDGLSAPYHKLRKDYREYPDTDKTWDLYVKWDDSGSTTVTISWSTSEAIGSGYDDVDFCNNIGTVLRDMTTQSSYSYTATVGATTHFKIICHKNSPPNTPSNPDPFNSETDVDVDADLSWTSGDPDPGDTVTYDVYFGTISPPPKQVSNQSGTSYNPGTMDYDETFYWQIVAWDSYDASSAGAEWDFTTEVNNPPNTPFNPDPFNGETDVDIDADLSWSGGDPDGDPVTYDVYFGTSSPPPKQVSNQSGESYDPGTMDYSDTYYWQIVSWDDKDATAAGSIWSFSTVANQPPNTPYNPDPFNGETDVDIDADLSWSGGDPDGDPVTYDVYFGTISPPPKLVSNQSGTSYDPGTMDYDETYYWQIVSWDDKDTTAAGPIWSFSTVANQPPNTPYNPDPGNGDTDVDVDADLSWSGGDPDGDPVTYDVYFGTISPPPKQVSNQSSESYDPGTMDYDDTYYWQIVAWDDKDATTAGPIWSFSTVANQPPNTPNNPNPGNGDTDVDVDADLSWSGGDPDGDPVTYDVYFGTSSPPPLVTSGRPFANYDPGTMDYSETYYWQIVAWDDKDASAIGPIWSFSTVINTPPNKPSLPDGPYVIPIGFYGEYSSHTTDPEEDQIWYKWSWGDGDYSPWLGPYDSGNTCMELNSWNNPGSYVVKVKAKDTLGLESDWSDGITITVTPGLVADADGPYSGFEDEPIQFYGSADGGEEPYSWNWDFGDGGSSTQQNPTHTYSNPGNYQVILEVTDNDDEFDTDSTSCHVTEVTEGVSANADGPYQGNVGEPIHFQGMATGGVPPYTWEWNFGDGGSSTQQNPTHTYTSSGTYTATLTVTDSEDDFDDDSSTVTVTGIPEDTTPPSVEIIKPQEKSFYFLNNRILPCCTIFIIGNIDVEVEASDSESGMDRVEFYVDGELQDTDDSSPYSWTWSEWAFFRHTIKVVAYDNAGNYNQEEIIVWKFF